MPDLKQALKDFVATSNSGKYKDEKTLISKFPELSGYDVQTLKDYVATSNSGKYKDEETLNSKFPELFTQKKNPIQNGVSNSANGSSDSQKIDPKTGFPKIDTNGPLPNFDEMKSVSKPVVNKPTRPETKGDYAKKIANKAFAEYDPNLTEERLQTEKEQSGILNNVSKAAKSIWNVTGEALGAINETFGGDSDYLTIDDYKPLQDEKKQYIQAAKQQNLPLTEDAIQKGAEDIFRKNDRIQQVEKRIDANLPENYDREGIWKDLKLDNLKQNDKLRSAIASIDVYQKEVEGFNKYATYIQSLPKEQLTKDKIDKYNSLLDQSKESRDALDYYNKNFPKLLQEVKSSDELLDVMKYNYNDYEKAYSNISNVLKTTGFATLKIAAETANYIDQKTDDGSAPTQADKTFKKVLKATTDVANEEIDKANTDSEQYIQYKHKDINNFSDLGSYGFQLVTQQAPIWATLAIAPTTGMTLMGTQSAGMQFRQMETEEMQPFTKQTTSGQKLATSYLYGYFEKKFEELGTVSIIKNLEHSIARASLGTRKLFQDGMLKELGNFGKQISFNFALEGGTEYLTSEAQIQTDKYVAGKEISTQQANENRSESFLGGAFMGGGMTMFGGVWGAVAQKARLYSDGKDIARTQEILSNIKDLDSEVKNNPNLTKEDISIIHNNMNKLMNESFDIVTKNAEKGKNFGKQENLFLVKINTVQEGLKAKFEEIKNSNLSNEQKEKLTKDLNDQFNSLEKNRNATLQGEFNSIPDIEKNIAFEKANHDNPKLDGITPLNDNDNENETANPNPKKPNPKNPNSGPETEVQKPSDAEKVETPKPQENLTEEEQFLSTFNDTEVDNVETPAEAKKTLPEVTDQEYLDFVENDFLSDERLTDIATKVRENEALTTFEKRIAKKKEKEISVINKKVQDEVAETNRKSEVDTLSKVPAMEKDEFLEYSKSEKPTEERLNAIAYKKANNVELNNFEAEVYQDNKKGIDKINKTKNLKENILDKVPTEQKHTVKDGKYTVAKNGKELELYDNNGQPASLTPATKQKYFLEALENGFMKRENDLPYPEGITQAEVERFELENETDPSVILEKLLETEPKVDGENIADTKDYAIAIYINKVTQSSFNRFGDKNNIGRAIATNYFSKEGREIDDLAQEISSKMGIEVTPQDVVDFIVANPNGTRSVLYPKNPAYQNLIDKFVELTGFRPTPSQIMDFKSKKEVTPAQIDFEFANEVEVNNKIDNDIVDKVQAQEEFDNWFSNLTPEEQIEFYFGLEQDYPNEYYQQRHNEQQEYGKSKETTSTGTPNRQGETKLDDSVGKKEQQDRPEIGNNNLSKRSSGETQTTIGKQGGNEGTGNKSGTTKRNSSDGKQGGTTGNTDTGKQGELEKLKESILTTPNVFIRWKNIVTKDAYLGKPGEGVFGEVNVGDKDFSAYKTPKGFKIKDLSNTVFDDYMSNNTFDLLEQEGYDAAYVMEIDGSIVLHVFDASKLELFDKSLPELRVEQKNDTESEGVKPIRQLGTGANVYFEENGIRVNDSKSGVQMNVQSKEDFGGMANWNIGFDNATKAVQIAKQLAKIYPQGVPKALLLEKVVEDMVNPKAGETKQEETPKSEPKKSSRKVRDEKLGGKINDAIKDLLGGLGKLNSGINPEDLIKAAKVIALYTEAGIYKLSDIIEDLYERTGEISKELFDAIKAGYASFRENEDEDIYSKLDENTRSVTYEKLINKINNDGIEQQSTEQGVPSPIGTLQPNSKRPSETISQQLLQKPSEKQGTGSRSQSQSNTVPRTNATIRKSSTGQGDLFSTNDGVLEQTESNPKEKVEVQIEQINQAEKQEPALVDFSMQDNEQDKFNATKKYTDNINALETLLTVINEKRKATPEEKNALSKYVGFGGLKEIAFNPDNEADWKESTAKYKDQVRKVIQLTKELDQALGINNSLSEIRAGILTAHYTPKTIIDTMFDVLEKLGFKNGNILEPSAGIGNFIGYMPSKMRSNSNITAVELDNLTGNILKHLYDDVNTQIRGIQDAIIPDNSQDVVISNVPFGNFKVFDKAFKGNREFLTKRIHNYFFAKALDKVREGGIVMFVTSKGILDSKGNREVREYLNKNADFLGAVRLPSTAFQNNANTSVVTDVIILRKNTAGEKNNQNFLDVVDLEVTDKNGDVKTITINKFFKENRNVLLGDIVPGGMYSEKDYSLTDADNKMGQIWDRVSEMLDQHKGTFQPTTNLNATNRIETDQDLLENTKIGNLTISNEGKILKRSENEMQEVSLPSYVKPKNVKKYIDTRVALFDLITAEYTGQPDSVVDGLRTKLNTLYLNAIKSIPAKEFNRIATEDGDGFNVLALTDKTGKRADILSKRTINPLQQKQNTDNVDEAIIISLYENAHVDMERIADLMQKPVKEILEIAKGKIFESPTGGFFTRDEYLSGNVKKKLAEVNQAIESGYTEFENNKAELEAVIPKDIPSVSIEVRLGSRWVPIDIINDFAEHLFKDDNVVINYSKSIDAYNNNGKAHSVNASEKWGTKRKNGADLLVDALHAATPAIYDTIDDKRVLNKEETEKAVQKFEEIRAEFENWVYTNAERRDRLGKIYNEKYNTTVRRKYEGTHLNIPGINGVTLYPHQKDAIWMLLQNNGGIIDHIVGAGKTFIMVAGTAEMKRTGVAKKPMILALKSTIPQIVETYKQSYPLAKILAPSEKDFQAKNRQKLFSQIALNDWDIIIMSHENYQAIPHHPDNVRKQIDDEIAEIEEERDALSGDKKALSGLEKRLKNLEAKLEKITDVAKDNSVYFQQMGIDHIMVDESQQFKNLAYMTKQRNVAGLSKAEGSRRAFNLLVGMRYLQETLGADKGTTFLSGTPISNSMVEMYSLLKYMRPNKMKELGFNTFDQWATTFASPTNEVEYTVTGQFKSKTRFREFINVPELSLLYNEIADVRNDDNLTLDKPKMKGGGYTTMFIPMNEEQADYGQRIIQFAKTKDGSVLGLQLTENQKTAYMLLATNLSSKMAIDMRLINKDFAYDPNGKVGKMTDEVVKVYQASNEHKGAQLIFSDLGTPKNKNNQSEMLKDYMEDELSIPQDTLVEIFGNFAEEGHRYQPMATIKQKAIDVLEIEENDFDDFMQQAKQSGESFNLYDEIKKRLIEKGIPENEIVFIHSYNNQKAKEKLFEQVNNGEIRVVLGSTQKLGTGVNVQKRLAAIHHLDVPWRPSDMEQRNGRGIRQGNWIAKLYLDNEMPVYAYATEKTLDGYKYQLLQTKQRFLDQVKSGNIEDRVVKENSEEGSDAYAIFVAELSGNKDILLKFKLEQEKERLTKQRRNFEGSLYEAQGNIRKLESNIPIIEENASKTKQDIESITNKAKYEVSVDKFENETKKLIIDNINGEVLKPEKDSKEAKENLPIDRTEYGKKAIELIDEARKTTKLDEYRKAFDINGLPILLKITNKKEFSNGREFMIQKVTLAILAPSGQTYTVNNSTVPGVLLNNIQKAIESIPDILEIQEKVLDKNKKDLAEYKELAKNDKFPKEEELKSVSEELKEIDKRIKDFEKDEDEDAQSVDEKPQDNKIRIGDAVYPNFNEDIDVSIVEGKNLKTNEANYLVKINKQLDYQSEYKKIVEPLFLENGGEWNKSHKAIIFSDKAKADFVVNEVSKRLSLENDLNNIRFQLGDQKAFETNDNTKATKENLQQEFPDAIIVQSESELPTVIQREIREQKAEGRISGVYYDGKVYMVADNIKTIGQATGTYRHEMLGHKGVIEHLGNKLDEYTTRIIDNAKGSQLRKLQKLAAKYGLPTDLNALTPEQKQLLGEEYIAMISENKAKYPKAWNDLVSFIRETLRKIGISLQVTIAEIQALIGKVEAKKAQTNKASSNIRFDLTNNKDLRLPQTIARQVLTQMQEENRNNVDKKTILNNAVATIQNTDWYNDLDGTRQQRVNNTTVKSLLENAIKEINYLEDKVDEYKQKLKDNKLTSREVFNDIVAFLQTNKIKGKITPTEVNRLIKSAVQITVKRDTSKALDDFMNLYKVIKEKALLRSDSVAKEKADVEYVTPIVEGLVESGYSLEDVLDYFETISQKRMAEILFHKEKSKLATEEERINKTKEAIEKQKQDLLNATNTSFREGLKQARLYWFNLISDRSYVPAELMNKTAMQQTYYQFKNTKGYGHNAKEMFKKAYDNIWKGLTKDKIELLHDTIQMMRIITIDNTREQNGLSPVQHPNNLAKIDAQSWLDNQRKELGENQFNDIQKRAKEYFKAYQEVLDLKLEHGFITQETYDALNGKDYQPRMFLHHAVNFDGDLSFEQKQQIISRSGLSKEQVKSLEDGSANSLILDAQWLLSNSISTLYQDIADNTLNNLFIAKEFPTAQEKYNDLLTIPTDQLTKKEKQFVKYFKELSEKVIPNDIIGFNSNNNDPIYKLDTPKNFVNKYYWADGVKHQFFMEEKLAQEFDGAKGLFLNENNKSTVGNLTGARLVKWFATGNNPLFMIVNTPRDFMWNVLVSEHYGNFTIKGKEISGIAPLAMVQMTYQLFPSTYDFVRTKLGYENTDMNLYLNHGGSMDYLHKQGQIASKSIGDRFIVKPLTSVLGKNKQPIIEDMIKNNYLSKGIGALNEWSELAFRIATFRRSINAQLKELGVENENEITDTIDENGIINQTRKEILDNIYRKATYDARSVLDFSQGGRLTKDLEEFIPYLNVGVQATRSYADAMKKRPLSTTFKTFQLVTMGAAATIALAMFMLVGDDDEPEEEKGKTVERKYVEFMEGISTETRSKYYLIPTKKRDEKGNRIAYKIAKEQFIIPYTNIIETLIENKIRTRSGFKEISRDQIKKRLFNDILEQNLSAKSIKDVPLFKAGTAWYAGYDLYRNKPIDKYAKTEALEGMGNPQVEDFYKHFGSQLEISPIRTKNAIESMITSPQSNPYLATGYEVMDYAFTDKSMDNLGTGIKDMLLKGLKNRTQTKSTEWTKAENILSESKNEQLHAMLKEEAIRQLYKDKAQEVIDGKATTEEVLNDLKSQYHGDPNYISYIKSFRSELKNSRREKGMSNVMQRIRIEKSPGAKAIMIINYYGDINSPENAEIKKELISKRIINAATMRYLKKKTAN